MYYLSEDTENNANNTFEEIEAPSHINKQQGKEDDSLDNQHSYTMVHLLSESLDGVADARSTQGWSPLSISSKYAIGSLVQTNYGSAIVIAFCNENQYALISFGTSSAMYFCKECDIGLVPQKF